MKVILKSSIDARVKYFKHKVTDWEELWLMENENGFFTDKDNNGNEILIVWPFYDFAINYLENNKNFQKQISKVNIRKFLEHYLSYIRAHGIKLLIFPTYSGKGTLFDADNFRNMMEEELAKYGDYDENSLKKRDYGRRL